MEVAAGEFVFVEGDEDALRDAGGEEGFFFGCAAIAPLDMIRLAEGDALGNPLADSFWGLVVVGFMSVGVVGMSGCGGHTAFSGWAQCNTAERFAEW